MSVSLESYEYLTKTSFLSVFTEHVHVVSIRKWPWMRVKMYHGWLKIKMSQ